MFRRIWETIKEILWLDKSKELTINFGEKDEIESSGNEISVIPEIKTASEEVQEQAWFTRANDLIAEFYYEPTPVYSSNFEAVDEEGNPQVIGYLQADGKITQNKKGGLLIEQEHEQFVDDVGLLKDNPNYAKPNLEKSTTANFNDFIKPKEDVPESNL